MNIDLKNKITCTLSCLIDHGTEQLRMERLLMQEKNNFIANLIKSPTQKISYSDCQFKWKRTAAQFNLKAAT